jgi:hypothetical protein
VGTDYGWELSKAGTFPQVPICKWQTVSNMCVNTVPAGLELVETGLYGFPKFKVRGAPENFEEASSRPIYSAFNLQRLDTGSSPLFGPYGMVFRPGFIQNMTQLAPTDTGLYAGCLLQAAPDLIGAFHPALTYLMPCVYCSIKWALMKGGCTCRAFGTCDLLAAG